MFSYLVSAHPVFKNNFLARLLVRFFCGGWGVELCTALCIPLQHIFGNDKIAGRSNLIVNLGL